MWGCRALAVAALALLLPVQTLGSEAASEESYETAQEPSFDGAGEEVVREVLRGQGLLPTLHKLTGNRENVNVTVAPVLFIGRDDGVSSELVSGLFDFVEGVPGQSEVVLAPYGDASTEDGERQSVAVVTNQETEELITSSAFSSVAKDVAVSFAVASDVVYSIHFTDLLRGEANNFALLQIALEHYLNFQARGLISKRPKRLHVVVLGADEQEARDRGVGQALEAQLAALWARIIKPESPQQEGEEEAAAEGASALSSVLEVKTAFLPHPTHAADAFEAGVNQLKATLEEQLATPVPFVRGKTLEGAVAALLRLSKAFMRGASSRVPKEDTVVSAFLLDKLVLRYSAQFRQDARRLFDSERGYNADFSKTCNELIDKYLANFQEEVYGAEAGGGVNTYLQGLDASQVAAVVRSKKERLRQLMLASVEPAYRRQLEFLRRLAMDERQKGLSALKYNWELVPGLDKANKEGGAMFKAGAAKQVCKGARWSYGAELQALKRAMEEQTNDILEAQRARGMYLPEKLRRPIGVQVNWLGANFFHFIQDCTCDPISIRTDASVLRMTGSRLKEPEREDLSPDSLGWLKSGKRSRRQYAWPKRIALDLLRNYDDLTYQFNSPKAIATY